MIIWYWTENKNHYQWPLESFGLSDVLMLQIWLRARVFPHVVVEATPRTQRAACWPRSTRPRGAPGSASPRLIHPFILNVQVRHTAGKLGINLIQRWQSIVKLVHSKFRTLMYNRLMLVPLHQVQIPKLSTWWTHSVISHPSQCSMNGITKAMVCSILSVGWWI